MATKEIHTETVGFASEGWNLAGTLYIPNLPGPHPALIVCHGAGEFKENYESLCCTLAESGVAALAIDMRGHGASAGPRFHVRIRDWVADLSAALVSLQEDGRIDAEKIGAFGFSSGGTAVLEAALKNPSLKALILLAPTVQNCLSWPNTLLINVLSWWGGAMQWLVGRELRISIGQMFERINLVADGEIQRALLADRQAMEPFRNFPLPGAREAFFVDTIQRVAGVRVPTLVLWGAQDELDSPNTGQLLYRQLTCDKRLEVITGCGHAGHLDRNRGQIVSWTARWTHEKLV